MSKTKSQILATSLKLFNEQGVSNVSLRTIATEMSISVGNLSYHFKKREEIIEALYLDLVKKMDEIFMFNDDEGFTLLERVFFASKKILNNFFIYRFFLLDFVSVIRNNKTIKEHYKNLLGVREQQFRFIFETLIEGGLIRKEELKNEYDYFFRRMQILNDFWISSVIIRSDELNEKIVEEYSKIINQSIYPYLTLKGKEDVKNLL